MRSLYLQLLRPAALLGYLAVCVLLGLVLAGSLVWASGWTWAGALASALPLALLYALLLPSAWDLARALPMAQRRASLGLLRYIVAALLAGGFWLAMATFWTAAWTDAGLSPPQAAALMAVSSGGYLLALLASEGVQGWERVLEATRRAEQSQARAVEAELLMLRNQVNPHFLFNCLNSISALTSFDPAGARQMTISLAQYFRQTLALSQRDWITLDEELAHCRGYVEIEQVRFGERLVLDCELPDGALRGLLPPMLLQPLFENAVKHGIAPRSEGGRLCLRAVRHGDWLHLRLDNPAASTEPPLQHLGTGTGLSNVRHRLQSLYGDRARLNAVREGDSFVVDITLPWKECS